MGWKKINGFNYLINHFGKIKRIETNKELSPIKNKHGYSIVSLCKNGIPTTKYIHRLVAEHFLDNDESKTQVNHKDGNKNNNSVCNLEWCTASENMTHAVKTGISGIVGESQHLSVLTETDVKKILTLIGTKPQHKIAKQYKVNQSVISRIKMNKIWKSIPRSKK